MQVVAIVSAWMLADPETIERLPDEADVDPDAAYLLDLSAAG